MIERVTGYRFEKDGLHTFYKIEKTRGAGASRAVRRSPSVEDMPELSRSRPHKEKEDREFWEVDQGHLHHMHLYNEDRISGPIREP